MTTKSISLCSTKNKLKVHKTFLFPKIALEINYTFYLGIVGHISFQASKNTKVCVYIYHHRIYRTNHISFLRAYLNHRSRFSSYSCDEKTN